MATNDPEQLLERLLKEPAESAWLEFKENNCDPELIGKWISACGNAAILAGKPRGFLVYGVNDRRQKVGTTVRLKDLKKGNENFQNWISRLITPPLMMELLDFSSEGKDFSIICIEPTYDRPVQFEGHEYIRIGENTKKLKDFPDHERAIWMATGRRKFEDAVAMPHQSVEQIFMRLDIETYYRLTGEEYPQAQAEIMRRFVSSHFLIDNMEGGYDITNLGAILFAKNLGDFPSVAAKSVRVINYVGKDKSKANGEIEGKFGYAVGFEGLLKYVLKNVPQDERYINGVRRMVPVFPETAIRETIANALIHQDFLMSGAGPVIEIYSDRVEIINPGNSLIEVDRIIDERRSRNEKLASAMRALHLCEERGGGLDKALLEIEAQNLPAFAFEPSEHSMRVVLFGPKKFSDLSREEKYNACFFHCVIRWVIRDYMSNATLRERFSLKPDEYQAASAIISEMVRRGRIVPADPNQSNKYAKYVPYWARPNAN